jgi:hypothetical protein
VPEPVAHDDREPERSGPRCWQCGSTDDAVTTREMSALSWVALAAGLFVWPLLVVGVFLREEVTRCPDCRAARGQGSVTFESRPALVVFGAVAALALLGVLLMCGLMGLALSARGQL